MNKSATFTLKTALYPLALDGMRDKGGRVGVPEARRLKRWREIFAGDDYLESWRLCDLAYDVGLGHHALPVEDMTGAAALTIYRNPGARSEACADKAYRIEDVALALVNLRLTGVDLPEALPLIEALCSRLRKTKRLRETQLSVLWSSKAERYASSRTLRTLLLWPAGKHADHFRHPNAKRLSDGRISIRGTTTNHRGFEMVCTAITQAEVNDLNAAGGGWIGAPEPFVTKKQLLDLLDNPQPKPVRLPDLCPTDRSNGKTGVVINFTDRSADHAWH